MSKYNFINKIVGEKIRELRKKSSFNQTELAGLLELTRTSVCNIETGRQTVTVETLLKLCAVFKCQPSELLPTIPTLQFKKEIKKTKVIQQGITMNPDFKW